MMNWSDYWSFLIRSISLVIVLFFATAAPGIAQQSQKLFYRHHSPVIQSGNDGPSRYNLADSLVTGSAYPDPKSVLYKSLIIPGWGQIVNKQAWKVPIVYGLLAGLTGYSIFLTKRYHDYRAAFYNANEDSPDDMRFGATPDFLEGITNLNLLRSNRNDLRNRRDFIYVTIGLAYGLNAIDAYIFAHLRSFDVSEDLSMRTKLKPSILAHSSPGVTLSVELFNKKK